MAKSIAVYTIPTCPWCRQLKEYLTQEHVEFTNHDVSVDKASFDEMMELTGQAGVPVIVIDGEVMIGFDREKVEEALKSGEPVEAQ